MLKTDPTDSFEYQENTTHMVLKKLGYINDITPTTWNYSLIGLTRVCPFPAGGDWSPSESLTGSADTPPLKDDSSSPDYPLSDQPMKMNSRQITSQTDLIRSAIQTIQVWSNLEANGRIVSEVNCVVSLEIDLKLTLNQDRNSDIFLLTDRFSRLTTL